MPCNERFSLARSWLPPALNVIGNPTEICASTSGSKKIGVPCVYHKNSDDAAIHEAASSFELEAEEYVSA